MESQLDVVEHSEACCCCCWSSSDFACMMLSCFSLLLLVAVLKLLMMRESSNWSLPFRLRLSVEPDVESVLLLLETLSTSTWELHTAENIFAELYKQAMHVGRQICNSTYIKDVFAQNENLSGMGAFFSAALASLTIDN